MPGYWEIQPTVLVCTLHTDVTTMAWAYGLRNLIIPGQPFGLSGMPFCHARNEACRQALKAGADHLFFLDSDVIPPRDTILRLIKHDLPVVSGIYCRRSPPHAVPVMIRNGQWVTEYPANSLIQVDLVGAGCLLIRRDVLEKLPPIDDKRGKHWFDWRVDMMGLLPQGEALSEDFSFCLQCRRHGIPIVVDTSLMARHIGYGQSTLGSFVPLDTTPIT